jgi:hypothetical protein
LPLVTEPRTVRVGARGGDALLHRAEAVPDGETSVPEQAQDALGQQTHLRGAAARVQEEQIEIGVGRKLAAAVAAERDDGADVFGLVEKLAALARPRRRAERPRHDRVQDEAARLGRPAPARAATVRHAQALILKPEEGAEALRDVGWVGQPLQAGEARDGVGERLLLKAAPRL